MKAIPPLEAMDLVHNKWDGAGSFRELFSQVQQILTKITTQPLEGVETSCTKWQAYEKAWEQALLNRKSTIKYIIIGEYPLEKSIYQNPDEVHRLEENHAFVLDLIPFAVSYQSKAKKGKEFQELLAKSAIYFLDRWERIQNREDLLDVNSAWLVFPYSSLYKAVSAFFKAREEVPFGIPKSRHLIWYTNTTQSLPDRIRVFYYFLAHPYGITGYR
ncbi:MAG: hypothetical protein ACTSU5_08410, partial [Promethearchaeota archaeon]